MLSRCGRALCAQTVKGRGRQAVCRAVRVGGAAGVRHEKDWAGDDSSDDRGCEGSTGIERGAVQGGRRCEREVGVGFEVRVCAALRVGAIAREQRGGGFILRPSDGASDVRGAER